MDYLRVDSGRCDGCGGCVAVCAALALLIAGAAVSYDADRCTGCGECLPVCPRGALAPA